MNLRSDNHLATNDFLRGLEASAKGMGSPSAPMVHEGRGGDGSTWRMLSPGAQYDYEAQAGDLWRNSAVAACLRILKTNFSEPLLGVATLDEDGNEEAVKGHELPDLIDKPNGHYDGGILWGATVLSLKCDGNAYWLKVYSRLGKLVELWWVPSWMIRPVWPQDGTKFIGAYRYEVNGRVIFLDPSDVVHFRQGIDPRNDRLGLADLKAAVREVATDNEAATFIGAILRNMGVPTVVISPLEQGGTFGEGVPDDIRSQWRQNNTGDRRGEPLVSDSLKVERLSFTPKEMSLGEIPDRLEDRICALTGVPAMLSGVSSGARHKTHANYAEARRALYEDTIIPEQRAVARTITHQLLIDFPATPAGAFVRWIYKGIQCLRENADAIATRAGTLYFDKKLLKRGEARLMIGLSAGPEDDLYYDEIIAVRATPPMPALPGPVEVKALATKDEGEDGNGPFGRKPVRPPAELPDEAPLRKALERYFADQMKAVVGTIPPATAPLPESFPSLADYDDPMSRAMTPVITAYWDESGGETIGRLKEATGLDLGAWEVTNPKVAEQIRDATLSFCRATNATTTMLLNDALAKLREELHSGIVEHGESIPELTKRVRSVFTLASESRARTIAATETCRAVHAAQLAADRESGVVAGLTWLLSSDACPLCQAQAGRSVRLGEAFATGQGGHPDYSTILHPPLHPNDRCTVVEVLKPEYGGPTDVEWGQPTGAVTEPEKVFEPFTDHKVQPDRIAKPEGRPGPPEKPPGDIIIPKERPRPTGPPAFPVDPSKLELVKALGGSTGAELVRDPATGALFVRKRGNNPGHLREEHHADNLYRAMGIDVPDSKLYEGEKPTKLARYIEGATTLGQLEHSDPAAYKAAVKQLRKGFAADALLGNWDVIGMQADNVLVSPEGRVYRVDNGGSLRYRAQGALKSAGQFGPEVMELDSLRDKGVNRSAAKVFDGLTDTQVKAQAKRLAAPKSYKAILTATPPELRDGIRNRLDFLKAHGKPTSKAAKGLLEFGSDTARMDAWGKKAYEAWARSLTTAERGAVTSYTGSNYTHINNLYRYGVGDENLKQLSKHLETGLAKASVPAPVRSFRGIKDWKHLGLTGPTPLPGTELGEASPASSSLWKQKAVDFAKHGPRPVILNIRVPKGATAAYVNAGDISVHPGEMELLVAPGKARYNVIGVNTSGRFPVIEVELLIV